VREMRGGEENSPQPRPESGGPRKASSPFANILICTSMFYLLLSRASIFPETRESCKRYSERVRELGSEIRMRAHSFHV